MGDMGEYFRDWKEAKRKRREENLAKAESMDTSGWDKKSEYHWRRKLNDKWLDYWPSRRKYQYDGRVMTGDVNKFIRKMSQGHK